MIDFAKTNGCDECGRTEIELHTATIGRKKITLCEKCLRELLEMTEKYVNRLDYPTSADTYDSDFTAEEIAEQTREHIRQMREEIDNIKRFNTLMKC